MLPICYHKEYIIIAYYYNTAEYVFCFDKSLIPQPSINVRGADQIKQQAMTVIMTLKNFPKGCHQYDGQLEIQTCRRGLPMSTQL